MITRPRHPLAALALGALLLLATACSSSSPSSTSTESSTTTTTAPASSSAAAVTNTWVGPPIDTSKLPLGTSHVSLTSSSVGGLWSCAAGNPRGGGAQVAGPWIDLAAGTWDMTKKVDVQGSVSWPMATYDESTTATSRTISSNGLPIGAVTGTFPIAANDPAYAYDRNPNRIAAQKISITLPLSPVPAASPSCLGFGTIGVLKNGVSLFAPLDELARDAVAYETQDSCDGHPQQTSVYHYHDIPSCILDASTGPSTVVGYAYDGFPIVVERDASGHLPTNADLDACHGRTSPILVDGRVVTTYHYSATYEFPYFMGCFTGSPTY